MKRLILVWVMILCLVPLGGWAEEETASALYPIRENGLWGYMNRAGEVVIEPQWDHAEPFDGDIALVGKVNPEGMVYGLIYRDGSFAVPVQYAGFEDCGAFYIIADQEDLFEATVGWYDKASGFFQEPIYDELDDTPTDSGLILASWTQLDGDICITHCTYLHRGTGETAFSFDYRGEPYTSGTFREGYAYWLIEDETGFDSFLLDMDGNRMVFPDGIRPGGDVCEGVLRVVDKDDRCGLGQPDGTIIVIPQYDFVEDAREGRTFIHVDERLGIMDIAGNILHEPRYAYDAGWDYLGGREEQFFCNGYALVKLCDEQNARSYVFLNQNGDVVFSMSQNPDSDTIMAPCVRPMSNRLVWYRVNSSSRTTYGLIRLSETGGEYLTGAIYEDISSPKEETLAFSEGLCPVKTDGQWGYIDENAVWVIPPQYDSADHYRDGLALVEKDGKLMYIDHSGAVVWHEK